MENLYSKILKASNIIEKSVRSSANFMVVSPKVAEEIENLNIRILRKKKLEQIKKVSNI